MARKINPEKGATIELYVVLDYEGNLKVRRQRGQVQWAYGSYAWAVRACTDDGDSVCPAVVDLGKPPLFILKKE